MSKKIDGDPTPQPDLPGAETGTISLRQTHPQLYNELDPARGTGVGAAFKNIECLYVRARQLQDLLKKPSPTLTEVYDAVEKMYAANLAASTSLQTQPDPYLQGAIATTLIAAHKFIISATALDKE